MPKVTVAIPTYNRENYLRIAIQSVLDQTFNDFELLILDNASQDNTTEVVASFSDHRITYIRNERNIGAVKNGSQAFHLAKGEYLIIFHDDDIMKPDLLKTEVMVLETHPEVVLVGANVENINEGGEIVKDCVMKLDEDILFEKYEYIKRSFSSEIYIPCSTWMYRLEFMRKTEIYFRDEIGLCADTYFLYQIDLRDEKLYLISEPLFSYRIHSQQDSQQDSFYEDIVSLYTYTFMLLSEMRQEELLKIVSCNARYRLITKLLNESIYKNVDDVSQKIKMIQTKPFWVADNNAEYKLKLFYCLSGIDSSGICFSKRDSCKKEDINHIENLYKIWLNKITSMKCGITSVLYKRDIKRIAIFGSVTTAYFLYKDSIKENIQVVSFIDNDSTKYYSNLCNIPIYREEWLLKYKNEFDAVIISVEGYHDILIKNRIINTLKDDKIIVLTWKELLEN